MAITTADGWFASAKQKIMIYKPSITTVANVPYSLFGAAGNPGAGTLAVGNTTTGVLFDDTYAGAPLVTAFQSGATGYLSAARHKNSVTASCILYDRLWGAGAVSLTTLAATNFSSQPSYTGRLPGGTDYSNLEILIELTTTVSATATTITVGYTNESGTGSRTTASSGSLSNFTTPRVVPLSLQAGDKGVQKVDSVTVGGTVASAGAFNVIVARRLGTFDIRVANAMDIQGWDVIGGPQVWDTSCFWPTIISDGTASGIVYLDLDIING
jgi:hypothetical protein